MPKHDKVWGFQAPLPKNERMSVLQHPTPEDLVPYIHEAFRNWTTLGGIQDVLLEALLLAKGRVLPMGEVTPDALRLATNQVLLTGLEELEKQDPEGARVLRARFLHGHTILQVAQDLRLSEDQINQRQRKALHTIAHLLILREKKIRQSFIETHERNLPPKNYFQLFGLEEAQHTLAEKLLDPHGYPLINLVGIGGIGKTALAQALTRRVIPEFYFERVLWIRMESPTLSGNAPTPELAYAAFLTQLAQALAFTGPVTPATEHQIQHLLQAAPCLLVIDNLEGEAEAKNIWPYLQRLVGISKILVTSRVRPPKELDLYTYPLAELGPAEARQLILSQAQNLGLTNLTEETEAPVEAIYRTTGGNPLAIKLVVSLARDLSLKKILGDFTRKKTGRVEAMYTSIYQQTWQVLPPEAKAILQAMPLASESGALPEQIQAMCGLAEDVFWEALQTLISYSLLEVLGTPQTRRYGIHGLTRSFIQTEIIGWLP